jgi:hypothetical protein
VEHVVFAAGAVFALILIVRFATKKTGRKGPSAQGRGGVIGYAAGSPGARARKPRRATLATLIGVNVICSLGLIAAVIAALTVEEALFRLALGLGSLIFFPVIAFRFLESQEPRDVLSLFGALAAFSILLWVFGSMWYFGDIAAFIQGMLNG